MSDIFIDIRMRNYYCVISNIGALLVIDSYQLIIASVNRLDGLIGQCEATGLATVCLCKH